MVLTTIWGSLTFLLMIGAAILTALAYWGCSSPFVHRIYLVELQLAQTSATVALRVGYAGACASISTPAETTSASTADTWTCNKNLLGENRTADDVAAWYLQSLDPTIQNPSYNTSLTTLVSTAESLQSQVFIGNEALSAFVLLVAGELISVVPIFFDHQKRARICTFLRFLSALFVSTAFMLEGAAYFATTRAIEAVSFLQTDLPKHLNVSQETIALVPGVISEYCQLAATILIGCFMLAAGVMYWLEYGRKHGSRQATQFQPGQSLPFFRRPGLMRWNGRPGPRQWW